MVSTYAALFSWLLIYINVVYEKCAEAVFL
jgi:hypothetical protein